MTGRPVFRPGPERLAPGRVPGGLVLHVYRLDGGLVFARVLDLGADIEAVATLDAAIVETAYVDGEPVVLVVYDGDDGHRWTIAEVVEAFL